jgi:DNA-binding transcriptional MerR regulator
MRMAELSRRTGVPVPTIKYYVREGLLPPGERTSPNQASYGEPHVRRLRLLRALVDVGGVSISAARLVVEQMAVPVVDTLDVLGKTQNAITPPREHVEDEAWVDASRHVDELIQRQGWQVHSANPARRSLADVLAALKRLGHDDYLAVLDDYAGMTDRLAATDVDMILRRKDIDSMAEAVVILTALGDVLLAALRRLAHENWATRRFGNLEHSPERP